MIKACIFDLDGTIADTLESMAYVANEIMEKFSLKPQPADNFRYYSGEGADMLIRRCLIDAGDPELVHYEEVRELYRRKFDEDPLYKVVPYKDMPETLQKLKHAGLKMAVCSNKPHVAAQKVVKAIYGDLFDEVMGQQEGIRRKPAPDGPLKIAEDFGVKPEECMYIGDTKTDMQTGSAAGMYTVGALWGFRDREELENNGADIVAAVPGDLFTIYEENSMIKMVASDLDGTLLIGGRQTLPEEIFPLVKELKKMGILFVAASGRQYANMRNLFAPVKDEMAFISENGGLAVQNEKLLYCDSFDKELVREIIQVIWEKPGAEFSCSTKDFYYIMPKTEHYRHLMIEEVKNQCKIIKSFDEITEPCMKVAVYEREGMTEESIQYWRERFKDRCTVVTSGFAWVDFVPFTTNKAKGIRKYQELLGIGPDECMAFGDEYNDIEMMKSVKYSFAMKHAKPGVKAAAFYETEKVEPVLRRLIAAGGDIKEVL